MAAINLRDMPEELHRALKVRAAQRGIKLYALVLEYLEEGLKRDKDMPKKGGKTCLKIGRILNCQTNPRSASKTCSNGYKS